MLTAISESEAYYETLTKNKVLLPKFVEFSRYFNPEVNLKSKEIAYKRNIADAQQIFYQELE